jgi:hypothetical protein
MFLRGLLDNIVFACQKQLDTTIKLEYLLWADSAVPYPTTVLLLQPMVSHDIVGQFDCIFIGPTRHNITIILPNYCSKAILQADTLIPRVWKRPSHVRPCFRPHPSSRAHALEQHIQACFDIYIPTSKRSHSTNIRNTLARLDLVPSPGAHTIAQRLFRYAVSASPSLTGRGARRNSKAVQPQPRPHVILRCR